MILHKNIQVIEDALIFFEDANYKFNIITYFLIDESIKNKVYDLIKGISSNNAIQFREGVSIYIHRKSIMNWNEYQWFQNQLRMAISRITKDLDSVKIRSNIESTSVDIIGKTWNFKNILELSQKCRKFNSIEKNIKIIPEFHEVDGIALYLKDYSKDPQELSTDTIDLVESFFGKNSIQKFPFEEENSYLSTINSTKQIVAKINCDFIKV